MPTDAQNRVAAQDSPVPGAQGRSREMFNFKQIWLLSFFLTSGFAIVPLIFFAVLDYNITLRLTLTEIVSRTARVTSNSWRSVSFFLNERQNALKYIVETRTYSELADSENLALILKSLRRTYGGFTDLGLIDAKGIQQAYIGPYQLIGKDYHEQKWFANVINRGRHISDVFLGYRNVPHIVIAIKHQNPRGDFYVLRASIEHSLDRILAEVNLTIDQNSEIPGERISDIFLINHQGVLQTESVRFGKVLNPIPIPVPEMSDQTNVIEGLEINGVPLVVGYRYIPETPFILMIAKDKKLLMGPWRESRIELIENLLISVTIVLLWILAITTFLVKRLKETDQRRIKYLHMAEYSNKLASIGRLAAGVAHEINNPLAIINEKAGLVKDMFQFKKEYQKDPKLLATMDAILGSVERCSRITRQLLSFARHMDVSVQQVDLKRLIQEVLGFLAKEAEYRSIDIIVNIADNIPNIESDRGKLQQIFLNIINNAFASMADGGTVKIQANMEKTEKVRIDISDTGCGISKENLDFIFEPFFSTKTDTGGTGLGLSITYGLVQELGGRIEVDSDLGKGTTFTIILPLNFPKEDGNDANTTCG